MKDLAAELRRGNHFGLSRKLLAQAWSKGIEDAALRADVRQKLALSTYKDPDLPAEQRLADALEILGEGEELAETSDQETLGLAGAIYKRRWELDSQKADLERSLAYYLRGYEVGPRTDQGYTGINAAYVLDVLSKLEADEARRAGARSELAERRSAQARRIREDVAAQLHPLVEREGTWWLYATMVEALFGLDRHDEAREWVRRGIEACPDVQAWEHRSTAVQLASLANVLGREADAAETFEASSGGAVLAELMEGRSVGVRTAFVGKVGLALSGGGFRASLFHIGVLARLAELDVLRHVEVLSCVSGGSILGAYYYLELKKLLEEKGDEDISRQDYLDLVKRIETNFLAGVQQNIRMRVAQDFGANLRMIFSPGFSRTQRAGELYEECLYSRVADGRGGTPRWMADLHMTPKGEKPGFMPRYDNWRRQAKVPELILNATTLNTGHNWQFTASWMGEPPGSIDTEVDANYRLRRMYYWEAPEPHRCIRLGHAVGASACVPGLFEPLPLEGLYPGRTVRLVDGGVHDNQGIVGILGADCQVALVSDASGQMNAVDEPSDGVVPVLLRASAIARGRVREEEFDELSVRERAGTLRGLMVVHLMKDLDEDPVDWEHCLDPHDASHEARPPHRRGPLTSYGVLKDVQRHIAEIRTDLDSFSDAEAFALMASGYRMTAHAFEHTRTLQRIPTHRGPAEGWRFLAVSRALEDVGEAQWLLRLLRVSPKRAFKVWHLAPRLRALGIGLIAVALVVSAWLTWSFRGQDLLEVGDLGAAALLALIGAAFGKWVVRIVQLRSAIQKAAIGVGLALLGWIVVPIHLRFWDSLFLKIGRVPKRGE